MCENGSLVWEADIVTEVIRYLDVMLNMLPLSPSLLFFPAPLIPSRSVSVNSHPLSQMANRTLVDTGGKKKAEARGG